eukprot:CAMPEP_0184969156 /NCGR_PEP_ID=MMETSP1098-20130426/1996_1 /TAXON_ID=89044 /ORGANISM="Spumella elongata, Strain CCAP 955/1" /LENGTH=161 /DNA_ID=CAMNT_0027490893 /DNA_START=32 /DNA_END=513 /DNA_ORIENTATION=+
MEEELSNLFNALKTGRMPSSLKSDGSQSSDSDVSSSKTIVYDLTGEEFAVSTDIAAQSSVVSVSDRHAGANDKIPTASSTTAGTESGDRAYTPDDIDNMSYKEIEQRYRLLTCQDEVLKAIGLRTPEVVNDGPDQEKVDLKGPAADLFDELSNTAAKNNPL